MTTPYEDLNFMADCIARGDDPRSVLGTAVRVALEAERARAAAELAPLPADLAEIQARADAATPGPWAMTSQGGIEPANYSGPGEDFTSIAAVREDRDWAFIAHARTDVPALVAELAELRAREERVLALLRLVEAADRDLLAGRPAHDVTEEREHALATAARILAEEVTS